MRALCDDNHSFLHRTPCNIRWSIVQLASIHLPSARYAKNRRGSRDGCLSTSEGEVREVLCRSIVLSASRLIEGPPGAGLVENPTRERRRKVP